MKKPKTVAVWGFTWRLPDWTHFNIDIEDCGVHYRTKRQADAERKRAVRFGRLVGPAVKLTLPAPQEPR